MGGHCPYSYSSHWLIPCRQGCYWWRTRWRPGGGRGTSEPRYGVRPGVPGARGALRAVSAIQLRFPKNRSFRVRNGMGVSPSLRAQPRNPWSKRALKKPLRPLAGEGSQPGLSRFRALPGCDRELSTSVRRSRHLPPPQREEGRGTRMAEVICDP